MASRINTRFVIILIAALLGLFGLLILAWNVAHKSPADLARIGDNFMSQGDYKQAEKAYSKAVNKDSTDVENINKWIDAMEHIVPETETEYSDRFNSDYIGAVKKASTILRNDIDAHEKFLQLRYDILRASYSRSLADAIINDTSGALAYFDGDGEQVQDWERLKRYRGLAIVEIVKHDGVLENDQYALAKEDLQRAIAADPDDVLSVVALMSINSAITNHNESETNVAARIETLESGLKLADEFLAAHPDSTTMMIQKVIVQAEIDRRKIFQTVVSDAQPAALKDSIRSFGDDIARIADLLLGKDSDQLDVTTVMTYYSLESAISPESKLSNTRRLVDRLIDSDKSDAETLWIAGRVAKESGEPEEALGWYSKINDLETPPLSFAGLRQYNFNREALLSQATIRVDQVEALPDDAAQSDIDAAIQTATESRDRFAATVTEDNWSLIMLDGKIARMKDNLTEALRLFKRFNELTQRNSPEGLWQEGITAFQIGQYGVARKAFRELIAIDTTSRKILAMITLAQLDTRLQDYQEAAQLYKDVLSVSPDLAIAKDGLESVNRLLNPGLNDDPVLAAIYTSRQMRQGTADVPGDYAGAIEYLRGAVKDLNYDPKVSLELASLLLDNNDVNGARSILNTSIQNYPDDESLQNMVQAMSSNDTTDILLAMIKNSSRDPLEKLLSLAQVAADRGRDAVLKDAIEQLQAMAPDDKRVIELVFINSLRKNDLDAAKRIAARPDLSRVTALSYQARIAVTEEDAPRAIELLKQAAATGTADSSVYQMLAILQRESGRIEDSIDSFERALEIRPDNPQTITEYLLTLISDRRNEDALAIARRLQRYGSSNPTFMNLWLNLESLYGGQDGRDFAIRQRERLLELNPTDKDNKYQLARMYISAKQWNDSRMLIDQLRSENDQLPYVELDATWYADQGTYQNKNGLVLANDVYAKYIESLEPPIGPEPYISNAEFMLNRGRPDLAVIAANEAVKRQTPDTMLGSKLLGDLYMRINNFSEAVTAYKDVINSGADSDNSIRNRLIGTLTRLERFKEAQEIYDTLPAEMKHDMITMLQAADIARGMGDDARASGLLDDAVARYPNDPYVYIKRAEIKIGDETLFNDLLSDISRALALQSNDWRAYRVRAAGYFAVDRREDALKDLRTAIRLNPSLDKSIYAVLNELLSPPSRAGEALDVAREVIASRPDDANLMTRIGGLFASRQDWNRAAELYGLAWNKRRSVNDGAMYIDALVRMSPPDADTAYNVITALAKMVGDINSTPGLLAAQALVLQARGRDDFAQQQLTKAFDLSVNSDQELINWAGNVSRYFEGLPSEKLVQYLEAIKRRNANEGVQHWLDLFIARRLVGEPSEIPRAVGILKRLESVESDPGIQVRAYRLHGSTLFNQDEYEQAAAVWEAGVKLFSDDWEMNNNLAYVLAMKLDRAQDALPYGQRAIDQNLAMSEAYETMAAINIRLGNYDKAEEMITTGNAYIKTISGQVTLLITSGRLGVARGDLVDARSRLNDAKSVLRSAPEAYPELEKDIEAFQAEIQSAGE